MSRPDASVIVPTLNEADILERNLAIVVESGAEVIVSDGGSSDRTVAVATALGVRVVTGSAGRGPQLNRGAAAATSDTFVFLHADTVLPERWPESVDRALSGGAVGGGFLVRFGSARPVFRLGSRIVNLRTRWSRSPLGDQAQFANRVAFEKTGGFPDWPILEDLEFIRRLKRLGRIAVLGPPATTSARRFEERGITRTIVVNWMIFALYFAGASPERLVRLYDNPR
ncbi:MAG: TIGR04283 family arsenosugar biosynthesis glycosyltransferase [Thermoanaerobaculia bacterium]